MKLYGFPASPNTWKVRAAAAHLAIPLELVFVDLAKGGSHTPEYLALNPTGRTPVLVDGDFTLWESGAIMQYIAGMSPNALWPEDRRTRADIMRWMSWDLAHWGKEACEPLTFERLVKPIVGLGAPDPVIVDRATESFHREARMLDAHLAKRSHLVGDGPTLADFCVASALFYTKEAGLPVEPYGHVRDWFARVAALPGWRETAPQFEAAA